MCLPGKHEDLNSDLLHPHTKPGMMTHAGHCSTVEADTGGPMGPAGLAAMSSMFSERACLKK